VGKTLVNNVASLNLIMRKTLIEMGLNLADLTPVHDISYNFDISYNYILRRPFPLKFMSVIHITYATMKMPGLKGDVTIKAYQRDALVCENDSLLHASRFGYKCNTYFCE
jgi:hypothetical protein